MLSSNNTEVEVKAENERVEAAESERNRFLVVISKRSFSAMHFQM